MQKYILSIDQGTTSTRAILVNKKGNAVYKASSEVKNLFPQLGYVEINADDIWISVVEVINKILIISNTTFDNIDSIGITNQRETTIIWDKKTGKAVYNAIVWQSKQTKYLCDEKEDKKDFIQNKTGLILNPYFSASKIRYILDHIENGQKRAEKGELLFGTVDTWIIYNLTKKSKHVTDISNASRTLLFNIFTLDYDEELLKLWNIPRCILPEIKQSSSCFGQADYFNSNVKICGVSGDQQSALFGQQCFEKGELKTTYGTGCFLLMNIDKPIISKSGLLTTIAWSIDNKVTYALEGSVLVGGAIVKWFIEEMKFFSKANESEEYANQVKDTAGVYLVPSFVGLGTPYWDDDVKGTILGLTRGSNSHHIVLAGLHSIAYQVKDVVEEMQKETNIKLKSLKVDGGASSNNLLMQFQADILECEVSTPKNIEVTALGVAYLSGLYTKFFKDLNSIKKNYNIKKVFKPTMDKKEIDNIYNKWKKAIEATKVFK